MTKETKGRAHYSPPRGWTLKDLVFEKEKPRQDKPGQKHKQRELTQQRSSG